MPSAAAAQTKIRTSANVPELTRQDNNLPEWLRIPAACRRFSVSRSWLYERLAAGDILSRSIRKRGAIRGIRLVNRDSLAAFIESAGSGYEKAGCAKCLQSTSVGAAEGLSKEVHS